MAYQLKSKNGQPIKKDGSPIMGTDQIGVKIEQLDDANLTFVAVASTEDEDRDKDILRQSGWDLKNFKKNPIIPWSHNYWDVPIAKSIRTWVDSTNKRLLFKPKFDSNDEFSRKIFSKYANGFLTSFSVGFRGTEYAQRDPNDWWGGKEFTKMELLEISAVAVPANPNANVNLSFDAIGITKSMQDIGYPDFFAKRKDSWLFYPIRDVGQFASPKQVAIDDTPGAFAIKATAIDEDHPEAKSEVVVGYSFDPSQFDEDLALSFVKENGEKVCKSYYYHVEFDDEKGISVSPKIEDSTITVSEVEAKEIEWADPNTVHGYSYRVYVDKSKIDDQKDSIQTVEDGSKDAGEEGTQVPEEKTPEVEPVADFQKMLAGALEEFDKKVKEAIAAVDTKISDLQTVVEKLVDKQGEICNNKTEPEDDTHILEIEEEVAGQKQDQDGSEEDLEVIGMDPDNKTSSEEETAIEIDEAEFKSVGEIGKIISEGLKANLKKHLTDAIHNSGKID